MYLFKILLLVIVPITLVAQKTTYTLEMSNPASHYFEVTLNFEGLPKNRNFVEVKMPVWTPGSYLVREYAKHVEGFTAFSGETMLASQKVRKNAWRIQTNKKRNFTVKYKVYSFEMTVRTNYLDDLHGYANGAATFMYLEELKYNPIELIIKPFYGWKTVSTALTKKGDFTFLAENFDELVDSPIEIGNHTELNFVASGVPHRIAMIGETSKYDPEKLVADYKKVCEAATTVIGEHPCKEYLFLVTHIPQGGGGLEHKNSTSLLVSKNAYTSEIGYQSMLGLVSHEYFHLWNVKRIRPVELGPFDYDNENYTNQLWVAEGLTSMYDNHILRRAGITSPERYLGEVAADFNSIENSAGNSVQSLAESSWDAWIKYYRPNENSNNSTVSYYTKGAVIATLLNLSIIEATNAEKSLDDVLRYLWEQYYIKYNIGFTEKEFQSAIEKVSGKSFDDFYKKYIYGTEAIDYLPFLEPFGCKLVNKASQGSFLGASFRGKNTITTIMRDSPAFLAGLNVGDEVLTINGEKVNDVSEAIKQKNIGEVLSFEVQRQGAKRAFEVKLTKSPLKDYQIERVLSPTAQQEKNYAKWLFIK